MGWNGSPRPCVDLRGPRGHACCLTAIINKETRQRRMKKKKSNRHNNQVKKKKKKKGKAQSLEEGNAKKGRMPNDVVRIINSPSTSSTDLATLYSHGYREKQKPSLPCSTDVRRFSSTYQKRKKKKS